MFTMQTYKQRRDTLKRTLGSGIVLFLANEEAAMNYADNPYHFRQDSTFLYYFGLDTASAAVVLDIDNNKEILFGDELSMDMIIWMGKKASLQEKAEACGISDLRPYHALSDYLNQPKSNDIHFLPPYRPEHLLKLHGLLNIPLDSINLNASVALIQAIVAQRELKSEEELCELDKAASLSADMHLAAMKIARPGIKEAEIAATMQAVALAAGGNLSFPIICTVNGQVLHNHYHGNTLEEGQLCLIDAGAETEMGYAGDLSHTFPVSKSFSPRQKDIYEISLHAHEKAVSLLKPGVRNIDVHNAACLAVAEGMKSLGLMRGDLDDAVRQGAHALFFPVGVGHMMGLDVHDMENYGEQYVGFTETLPKERKLFGLKSLRLGKELKPGFVLTVEPGIYFIPELIAMWKAEKRFVEFLNYEKIEQYRDFGGCRTEEDFVITETGCKMLGKEVPKTVADIEAYRA